jgi:hypothetical protein
MKNEEMTIEEWLTIRHEEGLKIDPSTAEVFWTHEMTLDPYGIYPELPEKSRQVGREYFARRPGSEIWVHFGDLPDKTREALWTGHSRELAFPAGLQGLTDSAGTRTRR